MQTTKKLSISLLVVFLTFLISCNDEDTPKLTSNDTAIVQTEAETDAYFEDADDMTVTAVASDDATFTGGKVSSGGRKVNSQDSRFDCATIEIVIDEASTFETPKGIITIDFGDGCEGPRGNVREGKIIIAFEGRRFLPGSTLVTTFENYKINGVQIEGTRTVSNVTGSIEAAPMFRIQVEDGKATWPDGTFATRVADFTREWVRANNALKDEWHLAGSAAGTNRNGNSYTMEILDTLVYKSECAIKNKIFMAVSGSKVITTGERQILIDYGSGDCDRSVTITINGESENIEVNGDV